jgi:hypothetical protein
MQKCQIYKQINFFCKDINFQITIFLDAIIANDFSKPFIELDITQVCT